MTTKKDDQPDESRPPTEEPEQTFPLFSEAGLTKSQSSEDPDPDHPDPGPDPAPSSSLRLTAADQQQIRALKAQGLGTRQIARALGRSRRTVQRVLGGTSPNAEDRSEAASQSKASKLDPFRARVQELAAKGLTSSRILRDLQGRGYQGGRTILDAYVRQVRAPLAPRKKVTRRFETEPAEEAQVDWATVRIPVSGVPVVFQILVVVLAYSRRAYLRFFDSQRRARLLEGLVLALEYFAGAPRKLVFDNMATAVLGRVGRERNVIWDPKLQALCEHYGCEPVACRVAHPDRKGIVESFIGYLQKDLLRGLEPSKRAELNPLARAWLDEVANKRVHGTTGLVPDEAFLLEKDFLIALPEHRFAAACDEELREVDEDATLSVASRRYSVPVALAHRTVKVRLYAERFEVLDRDGKVVLDRPYLAPEEKGRLAIDPEHYRDLDARRGKHTTATRRLQESLGERWPALEPFLEALHRRVKGLVHVHLRQLLRLVERYGEEPFLAAALRAHQANRHTAGGVQRILEHDHPDGGREDEPRPRSGAEARAHALLDDVDPGSLEGYAHLDTDTATGARAEPEADPPAATDGEEDTHGA